MKQSTKSFIKKNSKKYASVGSPVAEDNLINITDVVEENGVFKYSIDNGESYRSAPFPTTADIENLGSDREAPYAREEYVYKIEVPANTTISHVVIPYNTGATIFWGDGNTTFARAYSGAGNYSYNHTYINAGTYYITYYLTGENGYIYSLSAFSSQNGYVKAVRIPENTYEINNFQNIEIQDTLVIPKDTAIAEDCLQGTYFTKVKLEGNNSGRSMFRAMSYLKEVDGLENYADSFGGLLFYNCAALERATLGRSLTNISLAFYGTSSLKSVFIPNTITTIAAETFKNSNSSAVIYCEAESKPAGWDTYWNYYDASHELTVKWGYSKEEYLTEINGGLTDKSILNNRSSLQDATYSANYINSNFVPLTFASRLYLSKTGTNTADMVTTKPTLDNLHYISSTTTNTDYNWATPDITIRRTLENQVVLNSTNSFVVDLYFGLNRSETIGFGAKIKVSTDGTTWNYISTQQSYAEKAYTTDLSNEDLVVYTDALTSETTYPIGTLIDIEIYKKQSTATSLTTDYYCGVEIDGSGVYSFVEFNFANVNINTNQIEDGAVTKQKLSQDVQDQLDLKSDVQSISAGGTALTPDANGNVNIPLTGTSVLGVCSVDGSYGVGANGSGRLYVNQASTGLIDARQTNSSAIYLPVTPRQLNYAVKAALTDANHLTMTTQEQATAQSVLGIEFGIARL